MNRKLLALPIDQLALVAVIVVAAFVIASQGDPRTQGALNYHTEYRTNQTACDIAGVPEGISVTKYAVFEIYERDFLPCYRVTGPEDWYCCVPEGSHWTSGVPADFGYRANFTFASS